HLPTVSPSASASRRVNLALTGSTLVIAATCLLLAMAAPQQAVGGGQSSPQVFGAQAPPRDAVPERKGTGSLKGRVTSMDGSKALRRVQITVSSPDLGENRVVSTNSEGIFEVKDLPSGRFTVSASRA